MLLFYALVLKFPLFLHPVTPALHPEDNYLYRVILRGLDSVFHNAPILYSLLTFLLLIFQATLFNRISNHHKVLPKPNFLPGMSYILITSLLPDWSHFSVPGRRSLLSGSMRLLVAAAEDSVLFQNKNRVFPF